MTEKTFIGYVTRYALSEGIRKAELRYTGQEGMVMDMDVFMRSLHGEGKDWHYTFESAKKRAEEMRRKKIISLQKSIKKLEEMEFTP